MNPLAVAMGKTTLENPETTVPVKSRSLLRELELLAEHFAKLAEWWVKAAGDLTERGLPPSESLKAALSDASRDFVALRERVLEHGRSFSVCSHGKILAPSSLKELRVLLLEILTAEEPIVGGDGDREEVVKTLSRVLCIAHRDGTPFAPLAECQAKARRLLQEMPESGPEAWPIPPGIGAFSKLVALVDAPEAMSDKQWLALQDAVAREFGQALTIAASRGKLTAPPFMAMPDPRQEAERASEPIASSFPELLATEELSSPDAAAGETSDIPAAPVPPIPDDLPSEVEEFLDRLIEEASQARESQESSSSGVTGDSVRPAPILPEQEIPVPEASPLETEESSAEGSAPYEPSAPEALVSEPRGRENLAERNREQEKYAQKEELYNLALAQAERRLGSDHPEIADLLANLALLYHKQGKHADAETLYQRALLIREKSLGAEHPKVATSLNNLALLYRDQGRNAEAPKLWERSLAIVEKAFGPEHPKTALRVSNLADLFYAQGEYDRSERFYQRLVAILEKGCVGERPDVTASLKNYVELLRRTDRQEEARQVQSRIQALDG